MRVILAHSGKQHSYHVAQALYQLGHLQKFYTSSYITSHTLQQFFTKRGNTYWTRRFIEGLPGDYVDANWRFEVKEIIYRQLYGKTSKNQRAIYERDVSFDQYVAKKLNASKPDVFWGFQGSCYESIQKANACSIVSVCELATAHVTEAKKILGEEAKLHPEWADSLDNLVFPPMYEQRLREEPHLARHVIAASQFTKQTLINDGIAESKIIVLPLGFDIRHIPYQTRTDDITQRPLRLLYAGTITQRKGIKYLLDAMQSLPGKGRDIELHLIGGIQGSGEALKKYKSLFIYHSPVSQIALFQQYHYYDALVLPTVFEGFGLVILEAMAAGLPVITTPHSIGPELITDGENGYIIPVRNSVALRDTIELLRSKTREQYDSMRKSARKSAEFYTWDKYQGNLALLVNNNFVDFSIGLSGNIAR